MKNVKKIFAYMKDYKVYYILAILSMLISLMAYNYTPFLFSTAIDNILMDKPIESLRLAKAIDWLGGQAYLRANFWIVGLVILFFIFIRGFFLFLQKLLSARAVELSMRDLRDKLFDHIQRLPYDYHVKADTGDLLQRATSDIEIIRNFLFLQFLDLLTSLFIVVSVLFIILKMNRKMVLVSMAILPVLLVYSIYFFRKMKLIFKEREEKEAIMTTTLQENISGVRIVKAFNRQDYERAKFDKATREQRDIDHKITYNMAKYYSTSDVLCMSQILAVIIVGAILVYKNEISLGEYSAFVVYVEMLVWPIRQLGRVLTDMGQSFVAQERIEEILKIEEEDFSKSGERPEIKGHIVFDRVGFSYNNGEKILKDISFEVKAGESLGIIGGTGSGKTSLINLLPRFYDYNEGSIRIDGREIRDIDKSWLRENMGLVLQESFLYAKPIKDNIKLIDPKIEDKRVYKAAQTACIHEDILGFEEGYDTMVGEKGVSLSGGQKQRIAIARSIVEERPIVIFDDSLSAVDTETDMKIRQALNKRKEKATTIIVSHRISSLAQADQILVLDKGRIVESGRHEELLSQGGYYKKLYDIQNPVEDLI